MQLFMWICLNINIEKHFIRVVFTGKITLFTWTQHIDVLDFGEYFANINQLKLLLMFVLVRGNTVLALRTTWPIFRHWKPVFNFITAIITEQIDREFAPAILKRAIMSSISATGHIKLNILLKQTLSHVYPNPGQFLLLNFQNKHCCSTPGWALSPTEM